MNSDILPFCFRNGVIHDLSFEPKTITHRIYTWSCVTIINPEYVNDFIYLQHNWKNCFVKRISTKDLHKVYNDTKFMIFFEDDVFKPYIFESIFYGSVPVIFSKKVISCENPYILIFNDTKELISSCNYLLNNESELTKIQLYNKSWLSTKLDDLKNLINAKFIGY